jgi:integrase
VPEFPKILDVAKYVRRPLTRAEVDLLQANSPWPRGLFYALAFATLARRGALLSLTKSDVHLGEDDSSILLRAQHAKTKITQQVPVPKRLVEPLRQLIDECPANVPLFHSISGLNIHHMFRRDLKSSGIEHETERGIAVVHSLRHGGTTELLEKGVSVLLVQRMGGWKTLRVLSKHYAHLSPIRSRGEIDKVFG